MNELIFINTVYSHDQSFFRKLTFRRNNISCIVMTPTYYNVMGVGSIQGAPKSSLLQYLADNPSTV